MALGNGLFIKVKVEEVKKEEGRRRGKMRIASFSRNNDVSSWRKRRRKRWWWWWVVLMFPMRLWDELSIDF